MHTECILAVICSDNHFAIKLVFSICHFWGASIIPLVYFKPKNGISSQKMATGFDLSFHKRYILTRFSAWYFCPKKATII